MTEPLTFRDKTYPLSGNAYIHPDHPVDDYGCFDWSHPLATWSTWQDWAQELAEHDYGVTS